MTLQEHLRNSCRSAEIAVDLENAWRVKIEQGVGRELPDQLIDVVCREIALTESCPQRGNPGTTPAGVTAAICQPALERNPGAVKSSGESSNVG